MVTFRLLWLHPHHVILALLLQLTCHLLLIKTCPLSLLRLFHPNFRQTILSLTYLHISLIHWTKWMKLMIRLWLIPRKRLTCSMSDYVNGMLSLISVHTKPCQITKCYLTITQMFYVYPNYILYTTYIYVLYVFIMVYWYFINISVCLLMTSTSDSSLY